MKKNPWWQSGTASLSFLSRIKETCPQDPLTNGKEFPWACEELRNFPLVDKCWVSEQETQARKGGLKAQQSHSPGQSAAAPWVFYEGYEHSPPCKGKSINPYSRFPTLLPLQGVIYTKRHWLTQGAAVALPWAMRSLGFQPALAWDFQPAKFCNS